MLNASRKSILIVDDEPEMVEALVFEFQRKNFETYSAGGGDEAFEIFRTNKVDIVLSDVRMQNGDGRKLLKLIKKCNINLPVFIFITSDAEMTLEEAYDLGSEAVFLKPFNRKALVQAVTEILKTHDERLSPRPIRFEVSLTMDLEYAGLAEALEAKLLNIGRGGFFISLKDFIIPHVGQNIHFRILLKENPPLLLEGDGVVRWVRYENKKNLESGCGVEFLSLAEPSRSIIIQYINSLHTHEFIPHA